MLLRSQRSRFRINESGRGRLFQKRMQTAQQRLHLLWIEHRRRNQQCRRASRNQRWIRFDVGLNVRFRRLLVRLCIGGSISVRRNLDGRIGSKTQFQERFLARLLVCLGLRSHPSSFPGNSAGLDVVRMIITLTSVKGQVQSKRIFH